MLSKEEKNNIIKEFAISEKDSGSSEVQIALLSKRIHQIADHLKTFPKDKSAKLGLLKMVSKRRAFYNYLKKNDRDNYQKFVKKLKDKAYI
jgi:small subunit ribosomal protein S15